MSTDLCIFKEVVAGLSTLRAGALATMERERHQPSTNDADRMDDIIKHNKERAETLARLRDEFEREMARPI